MKNVKAGLFFTAAIITTTNLYAFSLLHAYDSLKDTYYIHKHYSHSNSNYFKTHTTDKKIVNYNFHPMKNNTLLEQNIFSDLHCNKIISNQVINSCYSYKYKGTMAVASVIEGKTLRLKHIAFRPKWYIDTHINKRYRGNSQDYSGSGYQRGHMASNWSNNYYWNIQKNVFNINANCVPQTPNLNMHVWVQAERYSRYEAKKLGFVDVINIVVYPLHPKKIGKDKISVPSAFYKIIYNNQKHFKKCFYYTNTQDNNWKPHSLWQHEVSCKIDFKAI